MGLVLPNQFEVPVFPLPGMVLFPGMVLPLYIFEERYRKMLADVMADQKLIAMGHLKDGWEGAEADPPFHEMMGLGRVASHHQNPDGTSNIALIGLARVRLKKEMDRNEPYRVALVETLKDKPVKDQKAARAARSALQIAAETLFRRSVKPEAREMLLKSLEEREEPGQAADFLSSIFLRDPPTRQRLLENLDAIDRAQKVLAMLDDLAASMEPEGPPITGSLEDFSVN